MLSLFIAKEVFRKIDKGLFLLTPENKGGRNVMRLVIWVRDFVVEVLGTLNC